MTCTNRNNGCRNCGERENGCGEERRRSNCCCCVNSSAVGFFDGIVRLEADTVLTINSSEALCWDTPNSANNMANLTILRLK